MEWIVLVVLVGGLMIWVASNFKTPGAPGPHRPHRRNRCRCGR